MKEGGSLGNHSPRSIRRGPMERQRRQPNLGVSGPRYGEESIHMREWMVAASRDCLPTGDLSEQVDLFRVMRDRLLTVREEEKTIRTQSY